MATEKSSDELEQLKAEIAKLKTDLSDITGSLRDLTERKASEGRERVKHAANNAWEPASKAIDSAESEISHHPLSSVALSFGIGMMLGKLLSK
ncbi:hypothetical protein BGP77_04060 [Saccharospirillum sp. MSK14-1]|uniref:DUF883 family protein n=1 Tax=Saccharospirillum sp. MSK14-1 TaxID=1897632 RepID=UPI000D3369B3|nr:DUF883 family protein [Saccharospirillum sp. MSK14-1]PTY36482.1 hypothetical protein BGP77_04060 [Saccharospirillum sp. MSK14-1]